MAFALLVVDLLQLAQDASIMGGMTDKPTQQGIMDACAPEWPPLEAWWDAVLA